MKKKYIFEEKLLSGWMRWPFITTLPMNQVTLQNQSLIHLIPLFFHLSHIMIIKLTTECPKNGFIMDCGETRAIVGAVSPV